MPKMKLLPEAAALLLDVVGSRGVPSATRQETLTQGLAAVGSYADPLDPLRFTVGDELQGIYRTAQDALAAAYRLRLAVAPTVDLRVGIGLGLIEVIDEASGIQDGPAWWNAREAITRVRALATEPGYRHARTAIEGDGTRSLDATARLIDAHIGQLRGDTVRTLWALLRGLSNTDAAREIGISESANSQRVINNDLRPLADAILALRP